MSNWANEGGKEIPDWVIILLVVISCICLFTALKNGALKKDEPNPSPSKSSHSLGRMYSEEGSGRSGPRDLSGYRQ